MRMKLSDVRLFCTGGSQSERQVLICLSLIAWRSGILHGPGESARICTIRMSNKNMGASSEREHHAATRNRGDWCLTPIPTISELKPHADFDLSWIRCACGLSKEG
jgi:hypothetical protein